MEAPSLEKELLSTLYALARLQKVTHQPSTSDLGQGHDLSTAPCPSSKEKDVLLRKVHDLVNRGVKVNVTSEFDTPLTLAVKSK